MKEVCSEDESNLAESWLYLRRSSSAIGYPRVVNLGEVTHMCVCDPLTKIFFPIIEGGPT
jgi:hypothetical protein